jgi:hypothetical protein
MTVKELFEFISQLYGIHDIYKYTDEGGIGISYYLIQNDNTLKLDSGSDYVSGRMIMEQNISNQIQGSYLDSKHIEGESLDFIILGLRSDLLPKQNESIQLFTEMIIIHELSHFIEQQNITSRLNLNFNSCDRKIGEMIEKEANKVADLTGTFQDLVHNKQFGEILNHLVSRRYNNLSPEFMRISMSKTLIHIEDDEPYKC